MALSLMGSHHNQSTVTREDEGGYTPRSCHGTLQVKRYPPASSRNRERQRFGGDESSYSRKGENRRPKRYSSDYGSKRSEYGRRTTGESDWDDGRWELEDTPRRDYRCREVSKRHHYPSPSPILRGASPESCLVSPWLGGNTSCSAGWDDGRREWEDTPRREDRGHSMSRRHRSDSCQVGTSHQLSSSVSSSTEGSEDGRITSFGIKNF